VEERRAFRVAADFEPITNGARRLLPQRKPSQMRPVGRRSFGSSARIGQTALSLCTEWSTNTRAISRTRENISIRCWTGGEMSKMLSKPAPRRSAIVAAEMVTRSLSGDQVHDRGSTEIPSYLYCSRIKNSRFLDTRLCRLRLQNNTTIPPGRPPDGESN
jgi:hypothetical protein